MNELWFRIATKFGDLVGRPLPNKILSCGDPNTGWGVLLNSTSAELDGVGPFEAHITWNGWPAGVISMNSGIIAAGELANEEAFVRWLDAL